MVSTGSAAQPRSHSPPRPQAYRCRAGDTGAGPCTGAGPAPRDSCLLQLVELKNGETYNGHLVSCDNWMNINLREVICTSRVRPDPPAPGSPTLRVPGEPSGSVPEGA